MYINSVLSFLGAWTELQKSHQAEIEEIERVLASLDPEYLPQRKNHFVGRRSKESILSLSDFHKIFISKLADLKWQKDVRLHLPTNKRPRFIAINCVKNGFGLELGLGKAPFIESKLFTGFPLLFQAQRLTIAAVLVPAASLVEWMPMGICSFEYVRDLLVELQPLPLKYPVVVVGLSNEPTPLEVYEMTSDLDQFLMNTVGLTLDQMVALNEADNYDFKLTVPDNRTMAKEVCAFANLPGGGVILLGIDKVGKIEGLLKGISLDKIQLKIVNIIQNSCSPTPEFRFYVFDAPNHPDRVILVLNIFELDHKPCMTLERVYIRSGASATPAGPERR